MDFRLEDRYVVIKTRYLTREQRLAIEGLIREQNLPVEDCVVIESDWPEYTPVCDMLFGRIDREASANRR
jgi:hypothetical protein